MGPEHANTLGCLLLRRLPVGMVSRFAEARSVHGDQMSGNKLDYDTTGKVSQRAGPAWRLTLDCATVIKAQPFHCSNLEDGTVVLGRVQESIGELLRVDLRCCGLICHFLQHKISL